MASPAHPFDLAGTLALVTGGGSGLGFAIAEGLGRAGARVVVNGRNRAKLEAATERLASADHCDGRAVRRDRSGGRRRGHRRDRSEQGAIDILVNNAGMNRRQPLDEFSLEEWRELLAANLDGPFVVARAVIPAMRERRRGKIVNVCSLASDLGRPNIVPYAASKGGLRMLTRALAVELAPSNVQVNAVFFEH